MDVFECLAISVILGIFISICAFFVNHPLIKPRESEIGLLKRIILYLVRTAHYFVALFILIYSLFSKIDLFYDLVVAGFIMFIYLHWQVLGACLLSIIERCLLNIEHDMFHNQVFLEVLQVHPKITDCVNEQIWIPFVILALRVIYELYRKNRVYEITE